MSDKVRATSVLAYNEIKDRGLLSHLRWKVYDCVFRLGPITSAEVDDQLKAPGQLRPGFHKRLSELRSLGVVRETGDRRCRVTGRRAVQWIATGRLPESNEDPPPAPRPTAAEFGEAGRIIRYWQRSARLAGEPESPEIAKLLDWIDRISG